MKITHLIYSFETGGAETMLIDIVNEQINLADVNIVVINKKYNAGLFATIDKRVKVYFINRTESSKNPYPICKLNFLLVKLSSDVLHCHNHNIIPLLLPSFKKKACLTVHDVGITSMYFNQYSKLFAVSKIVSDDIYNRSGFRAVLIYNGICTEKVSKKVACSNSDVFNVVIVSRLYHLKKGQHLAIESLRILKEKGIGNIKLYLIGAGSSEQYLKELVAKYGLTEDVILLGLKDRDYVYAHLIDYDLLLQPSIFEGFGLTVAEGMAAKVPVLVSDIDGPREIIEYGKYGFHFQAGNPESLADQLCMRMNQYASTDQKQIVESAYQHVISNFNIKITAATYIQNYQFN